MSINFTGSPYTQNFDTLAPSGTTNPWANDTTLDGWYLFRQPVPGTAITSYASDSGTSTSGSFYSYGSTGSSDRALGGLGSGGTYFGSPASGAIAGWVAFAATNTSGSAFSSFTLSFNGEQWRNGGNTTAQPMVLEYGFGATFDAVTTWTAPGSNFDWISPVATATAGAVDGNTTGRVNSRGGTVTTSWANGDTLWIRWVERNDAGNDHGLAIDDFSLTTSTVPQPGITLTQTGGSTSVVEGGATDTYTIALNTTPTGAVTVAIVAPDSQTQISSDGTNFASSLNLTFSSTSPQTVTVRAFDDTAIEAPTHTGTLTHTITSSADPTYSGLTIPNLTISITDNDIPPTLRIRDIQGIAHRSPLVGQSVSNVAGIVTAVASNGFYFQDPNPDNDDRTSEGIFVFTSAAPTVAVGDSIQVGGTVSEFRPGNNANNLTITQITSPAITILSSGNALPAATILGIGGRAIPTQVIDNDTTGNIETGTTIFDPAQDGIDFYESLEGMLVQINNPITTSPRATFSASEEIWVLADNGANATSRTARGGSLITASDFNPERIQIDDLINAAVTLPQVDVGAQLSTIVGVVSYDFNNYEVLVPTAPTVVQASPLQREVTNLVGTSSQLTVATFNVENLDPNDGAAKFTGIANAIVNNLLSPDIINLEEVQDNNGATNDSVVDASVTYQTLINAIVAAGGPTYQFRQINPVDDTNGGEPGGNIRVGFLFNPNRVTFVDRPGGSATTSTTVTDIGNDGIPDLSASPGLIDPTNAAFNASRKPLVGEFLFNGQTVYVIGNHFNSKGGDQPLFGPNQPPTLTSEAQRNQQATIVRNFVQSILAINPNANVIVAGDLNDFEFSNPLTILEGAGLNTLVETLPANERYTYNFQGNAQVLDHILVSNNLLTRLDGFDVVHINSEFATQVSDHDPVLARFNLAALNGNPIANADSVTTAEDNAITFNVLANDTDPNNDVLTVSSFTATSNGSLVSNGNGSFTYNPNINFFGGDSFNYTISDGRGGTATATVSLTVTPVNDPAIITGTSTGSVTEDAAINTATGTLTATDIDSLTTFVAQTNTNGTYGSFAIATDGSWTYTLDNSRTATNALAAGQTVTDGFTVATADGTTQAITLTITGSNDAPVANADSATTTDTQPVTINVLANDTDVDGGPLNVTGFTSATKGSVTQNGNNFTYTPNIGASGTDSFTYTINDGNGGTATGTVNLTINLGSNEILGTDGNDNLVGTSRNDVIRALAGNDTLDGAAGADTLIGGIGNDTYIVDALDTIVEKPGEGTDLVRTAITYSLATIANVENLTLTGSANINGTGNALDNVITGNSGINILAGGAGNDTYVVGTGDTVVENEGEGTDLVQASVTFSIANFNHVENLTLTGSAAINGTGNGLDNVITGNSANNTLNGGDGNDTLNGGGGNDTLRGGNGNDLLDGGTGADRMEGGAGDDTYIVDNEGDRVVEASGAGIDTVRSSISFVLSSNVENLTLTGTAALEGVGNGLNNVITGNAGSNELSGGGGNDTLDGGAGNDFLNGGSGNDTLTGGAGSDNLTGGTGNDTFVYTSLSDRGDTITDFNPSQDKLDLSGLNLGANPIASSFLRFQQSGSNTLVQIDTDGTGAAASFVTLVTLQNVTATSLNIGTNVLI